MLPKSKKLNRTLFKETTLKSKKIESENVSIRYSYKNSAEPSRFSVIIPAKVAKKAVVRNKIKRQTYSMLKEFENSKGYWAIVYIKKRAVSIDYMALNKEIRDILSRI